VSEHGALKTEIKLDGSTTVSGDAGEVKLKDGAHVTRIQVDQRLDAPDFFSLTLQSMSQEKMIMVDSAKPGMKVEILLGYDTSVSIFEGEVTYLEPSFSDKRQEITLSGYDYTHRLTRGTNSRAFGDGHKANDKISAVIQKVVGDSGGRKSGKADGSNNLAVTASGDDVKFEYVPQVEVNDYQFMKSLGGVSGATIKPVAKDSKKVEFKPTVTSGNADARHLPRQCQTRRDRRWRGGRISACRPCIRSRASRFGVGIRRRRSRSWAWPRPSTAAPSTGSPDIRPRVRRTSAPRPRGTR
jgi:hypothetical protein